MEEEKHASHPKRSMPLRLPNSSLVQVGGKQERLRCASGIPRNNRDGPQNSMNPGDETQAPIGSISTDDQNQRITRNFS
jgi:hypothetical protein